jgi:tRNA pseudouridine55 synthase
MQRPPAYSAMWVDGERAYDLARAGAPPELPERPVTIHEIHVAEYDFPRLSITVRCGKGTYIRSLARDIGLAATGAAGCLTSLRRTAIGPYRVEDATRLEDLPAVLTEADLRRPSE